MTDIVDEIVETRGFKSLPPYYEVMRPYPRLMEQVWTALKVSLADGALDMKTKELIAVAISVVMGARYATDAHILTARNLGASNDEIEEVLMLVNAFAQTAMMCSAFDPKFDPSVLDK